MVDGRSGEGGVRDRIAASRDLAVVGASAPLALAFLLGPVPRVAVLDTLVALGFLFVLPGYAFVVALFPDPGDAGGDDWPLAITGFERAAFAVGGSLAIVMLAGGALAFSPYGLSRFTIAVSVGLLTLCLLGVAAGRRYRRSARRESPVPRENAALRTRERSARAAPSPLAVALVVLCLIAVAGIAGIGLMPEERYTEASVLSPADNGTLLADAHPETVRANEATPFWVRLSNHEGRSILYTVVVRLERVGDDPTVVESSRELDRFDVAIPAGGTRTTRQSVAPPLTGPVRLRFLVYEREVPETPSPANADHALHVWLTVEDATGEGGR